MEWHFGTIRGVQLYFHVSLLFLLFYIILVATAQFPAVVDRSQVDLSAIHGTPFIWGGVFAIALLLSVILHEFGHVIVAQSLGTKVHRITLLMLGGISQMDPLPEKKYAEFQVAVAGPLVSFALGGVLIVLGKLTRSTDIELFSYWLSRANIVLGIFNLLPAFPTDGGRVLRSILAARQGKLQGTENAVRMSKAFAWGFGILGFLQFNVLLMLIAVFLYGAAKTELTLLIGQDLLKGLRAADAGRYLEAVPDNYSLEQVSEQMVRTRSLILPVLRSTGGVGMIHVEQLKKVPREQWGETPVSRMMVSVSESIDVNDPLEEVLKREVFIASGGLPLLQEGQIVGIIQHHDISELIQFRSLEVGSYSKKKLAA